MPMIPAYFLNFCALLHTFHHASAYFWLQYDDAVHMLSYIIGTLGFFLKHSLTLNKNVFLIVPVHIKICTLPIYCNVITVRSLMCTSNCNNLDLWLFEVSINVEMINYHIICAFANLIVTVRLDPNLQTPSMISPFHCY